MLSTSQKKAKKKQQRRCICDTLKSTNSQRKTHNSCHEPNIPRKKGQNQNLSEDVTLKTNCSMLSTSSRARREDIRKHFNKTLENCQYNSHKSECKLKTSENDVIIKTNGYFSKTRNQQDKIELTRVHYLSDVSLMISLLSLQFSCSWRLKHRSVEAS